jgi:uncharacterized membrane protein
VENLAPETDNDKLLAALSYFLAPWVGLVLFLTSSRAKPYLRYHAEQSMVLGIVAYVLIALLWWTCILLIIPVAALLYYTYLAYTKPVFTIPVITDLTKRVFSDFPG